jgi:RNA polymerase sigma-70 factor (ECF subfamily)
VSGSPAVPDHGTVLLSLYDRALPQVYGYLRPRCGSVPVAEDLTAETFLAAVSSIRRGAVSEVTVAWLVGIARHKLVDHWRRQAREERKLQLAHDESITMDDRWDSGLDVVRAREVLTELGAQHRAALTLRYLDGLSVREVADELGRTEHATESLLVRARTAFRALYEDTSATERADDGGHDGGHHAGHDGGQSDG